MTFRESKRDKLHRLPVLRIMSALGMVAWQSSKYGEADQKLRLVHPLAWVYIVVMSAASLVMEGFPRTVRDVRSFLKNSAVWF